MPKTVAEFIASVAEKAGIPASDPTLKDLLSNNNLMGINVDDAFVSSINTKLMNEEAAKNNSALINHFRATNMNGVDARLTALLDELGYDDTTKATIVAELSAEKSTPEKAAKLTKKVQALEREKALAGKGDKADMQKEIDRLNGEIRQTLANHKKEQDLAKKALDDKDLDFDLNLNLLNYNFDLPEALPMKERLSIGKNRILEAVRQQYPDAMLKNVNGSLAIVNADGSKIYDKEHNEVVYSKFADGVLAPILKATDNGGTQEPDGKKIIVSRDAPVNNTAFKSKAEQRMKEFEAGSVTDN